MAIRKNQASQTSLEILHKKVNTLVVTYQNESDSVKKDFLIKDLLDICEDMVNHNCTKFEHQHGGYGVDFEEIKSLALGLALLKALKNYEIERGNFLGHWEIIIQRTVINEVNRRRTNKEKANYLATSGNTVIATDNGVECELFDFIADINSEFEDDSCLRVAYFQLVDEFLKQEKYGELMRFELLSDEERKRMTLLYFGETEYTSTVRMRVLRTRKRFREFLKSKGYNCSIS